ncbi:integral membrane protein [Colletotrichum higginsianum]|uniref:Integral membrane protein n=1 Tax=Colletotrichum higginsianum (strain IMI 349063) TaxID=759273 RepID=H1VV17_COLHI|nr:integral membrane protein [Colletotrichum higginsianum]
MTILQIFYVNSILYVLLLFIAKVSICALYARVFVDPKFRRKVRFVLYFFTGHFVLYLFLAALQCVPVQSVWDRTIEGRCLNLFAISYTGAAGSILEDILLIIMPIPELMKLQLGRQKKLALGFMFAVGSL